MKNFIITIVDYPFATVISTFVLGWIFMPLVIKIAKQWSMVVKPNKRTTHNGNIPIVGGLDIFVSFIIVYFLFSKDIPNSDFVFAGLFVILLVGFVDDLIDLTPSMKLLGEIVSAFFLVVLGNVRMLSLSNFFGVNVLPAGWSIVISIVAFLGITNALNFIDGVDGLASGLGIMFFLCFALYFQLIHYWAISVLAYALVGSLTVFFVFNVFGKKHKIFMGDSGALMVGYMLTFFSFNLMNINLPENMPNIPAALHIAAAPVACFVLMFVPLFDTFRVILTRIRHKKMPFMPDKNHVHHLLLSLGLSHKKVTFALMLVSALFIALAVIGRNWSNEILLSVSFVIGFIFVWILWRLVDKKHSRN